MARIRTYTPEQASEVRVDDWLIGTDSTTGETRNFPLAAIADFFQGDYGISNVFERDNNGVSELVFVVGDGTRPNIVVPIQNVGSTLLRGTTPPANTLGKDGDFYIQLIPDNPTFFGPKANGVWPTPGLSLVGPDGARGNDGRTILSGSGAPLDSLGEDGDFYIDTSASSLYGPKLTTWPPSVSLIGPRGNDGSNGSNGIDGRSILNGSGAPSDTIGANGDFYIDNDVHCLYGPKVSGTWPTTCTSLVGTAGSNGADGADGRTILNGAVTPPDSLGSEGDFYIDTTDTTLYGPKGATSWPSTGIRLIGMDGTNGTDGTNGIDGTNGVQGRYDFTIYRRLSSRPSTPSGGTITTGTLTGAPADWSTTVSGTAGNQQLWISRAVYDPANPTNTLVWRQPIQAGTQGADGADGRTILSGSDDPNTTDPAGSQPGDFYIQIGTDSRILFGPRLGVSPFWPTPGTQLIGSAGSDGSDGAAAGFGTPTASPLSAGSQPTVTVDPLSPDTAKIFQFGIPTGASGTDGTDGADGRTVLNGSGAPLDSNGEDGDFYIDTDDTVLYGPKASGSWPSPGTSLVGTNGTNGTDGTDGRDGTDGTDGVGITSIVRTNGDGTAGTTDEYTITYTNGTTSTFSVVNGSAGQDGQQGPEGRFLIYIYGNFSSAPTRPSDSTYTYSTRTLTDVMTGWSETYTAGDNYFAFGVVDPSRESGTNPDDSVTWTTPAELTGIPVQGNPGPTGPRGPMGVQGDRGEDGPAGTMGPQGISRLVLYSPNDTPVTGATLNTSTFAVTASGWSTTFNTGDYVSSALINPRLFSGATYTIPNNLWSTPVQASAVGPSGPPGPAGADGRDAVDPNSFTRINVTGEARTQDTVVADSNDDTLTFNAGPGISITTDAADDTITFQVTPTTPVNPNEHGNIEIGRLDLENFDRAATGNQNVGVILTWTSSNIVGDVTINVNVQGGTPSSQSFTVANTGTYTTPRFSNVSFPADVSVEISGTDGAGVRQSDHMSREFTAGTVPQFSADMQGVSNIATGVAIAANLTVTGNSGFTFTLENPRFTGPGSLTVTTPSNSTVRVTGGADTPSGNHVISVDVRYVQTGNTSNTGVITVSHSINIYQAYFYGIETAIPSAFVDNSTLTASSVAAANGATAVFTGGAVDRVAVLNIANTVSPTSFTATAGGFSIVVEMPFDMVAGTSYTTYYFVMSNSLPLTITINT